MLFANVICGAFPPLPDASDSLWHPFWPLRIFLTGIVTHIFWRHIFVFFFVKNSSIPNPWSNFNCYFGIWIVILVSHKEFVIVGYIIHQDTIEASFSEIVTHIFLMGIPLEYWCYAHISYCFLQTNLIGSFGEHKYVRNIDIPKGCPLEKYA